MYVYNVFLFALFVSYKTTSADNDVKCSIKDDTCLKKYYQKTLEEAAEKGLTSVDIPQIDPFPLKNISIPVIDSVKLTINGVVKGMKSCIITHHHLDLDKKTGNLGIVCDVSISGHFYLTGYSEILQKLVNIKALSGEGDEKVKIDKLKIDITFTIYPVIRDGVVYLHQPSSGFDYTFNAENLTLVTENFFVGNSDISKFVEIYVNGNWKFLLRSFGKKFIDHALKFYFDYVEKFYKETPASNFIMEDLAYAVKE